MNDVFLNIKRNDQDEENKQRHISRYEFALNFIKNGSFVLDCACGSGYGSEILSKKANKVIGIDLDKTTIDFANKYYKNDKISFIEEDLYTIDFPEDSFDVIISLETLEHIKDSYLYLEKIKKMIKKGGVAVLSTPMLRFKNGKPFVTNPFHINEMKREDFLKLTTKVFGDNCKYYAQHQTQFFPLTYENTGFCIAVCKNE